MWINRLLVSFLADRNWDKTSNFVLKRMPLGLYTLNYWVQPFLSLIRPQLCRTLLDTCHAVLSCQ